MKLFVLFEVLTMMLASDKNDFVENNAKSMSESNYIGTIYKESTSKWEAHRWSTNEKKLVYSGYYNDEESAAHASDTLARKLIANGEKSHMLNFPDDDSKVYTDEETPSSIYIGVYYFKANKQWCAQRWSKKEKKVIYNGTTYKDEETAAHASDTLAKTLMLNGEKKHKLNFPEDDIEVYSKQKFSKYFGIYYHRTKEKWEASRRSKHEKKNVYNGTYKDEETAAHASDTLARKLLANGEKGHLLNFPDDHIEVHQAVHEISSSFGVSYIKLRSTWGAKRYSRIEKKMIYNGTAYNDEKSAAYASDNLARRLIANGELNHKINFPNDHTEMNTKETKYQIKRKRQENSENSQDEVLSN